MFEKYNTIKKARYIHTQIDAGIYVKKRLQRGRIWIGRG